MSLRHLCLLSKEMYTEHEKHTVNDNCPMAIQPYSLRWPKREQGSPVFPSAGLWAVLSPRTGPF